MLEVITSNAISLTDMDPIVDDYIEENEGTEIMNNAQHDLVAEDQIYINKHTISEVMKRYALSREFRFIDVRSSTTRLEILNVYQFFLIIFSRLTVFLYVF